VTQIIFIERRAEHVAVAQPMPVRQEPRPSRTLKRSAPAQDAGLLVEEVSKGAAESLLAPKPGPLNVELPTLPIRFATPGERALADDALPNLQGPQRMQVKFHDMSLGGRLQAMSKRRYCGELRGALARQPQSANAILSSMRERGCEM